MDNLTHTFAGLWVGEFTYRLVRRRSNQDDAIEEKPLRRSRRAWFWFIGFAANNFPDLDFVFSSSLPQPLGYLLHHRGHTHTLGGIVVEAFMLLGICFIFPSFRRLWRDDRESRIGLFSLAFVGLVMHVAFDALNSYGVHPFYPLSSRWFYSDLVFIIEPTMWVIFATPFALALRSKWWRWSWYALITLVPLILGLFQLIPFFALLFLWLLTTLLVATQTSRGTSTRSFRYSAIALGLFLFGQLIFSTQANKKLLAVSKIQFADEKILDNSLTPFPADPLCWQFNSLSVKPDGDTYIMRRGTLALLSSLFSVERCKLPVPGVDMNEPSIAFHSGILWFNESTYSLTDFSKHADNCWFNAWLRFARMPGFTDVVAFDWRYARIGRENFTSFRFANFEGRECPRFVPPWMHPRADLIELSRAAR